MQILRLRRVRRHCVPTDPANATDRTATQAPLMDRRDRGRHSGWATRCD